MESIITLYGSSITALVGLCILLVLQILVADVIGIKRRHVPGTTINSDHNDALFRASRTVANTNESIALFICALLFSMFSGADPSTIAYAAWTYVGARAVYAGCYYANLQMLRSISFGVSLICMVSLVVTGFMA